MDKFKIGGHFYNVVREKNRSSNEGYVGQILCGSKTIRLQDNMCAEQENDTLLHEIIHGMLDFMGETDKNKDEKSVERVAQGIIMLIVDNKEFFRTLLGD